MIGLFPNNVSPRWYIRLNDVAIGIAALFLLGFGITHFTTDTLRQALSIDRIAAALSVVLIAYGIFGHRLLKDKSLPAASLLSFGLLSFLVGVQIIHSGGFASPFLALWVLIVILAGMFGWPVIAAVGLFSNAYYVLLVTGIAGDLKTLGQSVLYLIATEIPLLASLAVWVNGAPKPKPEQGTVDLLSNSLESERNKSEILINSIADGVIVVNDQSLITVFNPAAELITGWPQADSIGLNYHSVMTLENEQGKPLGDERDPFQLVFSKGKHVTDNDCVLSTKNGKKLAVSIVASPIKRTDESISAVIGVFRDISEQRSQERQRAEFISTASHEMRTPVAAIEGYLALAMNENVSKIDTKAREYLTKAHASTQHLGKLFQDLLTAAKTEDGRLQNKPRVVEMGAFLEELADSVRFAAEKKGLRVQYDFGTAQQTANTKQIVRPLYYILVDPDRMREVITNLFDNAVKYTEEGKITIRLTGDTERIVVSVSDTGAGIPKEDIAHLFEKFYRVDNTATRQVGGTGLGLFISRKIVELNNGRIWVESEVGKGSTFHIQLPRLDDQRADTLLKKEQAEKTPLSDVVQTPVL